MAQTVLTPFDMSGLEIRNVLAENVGALPGPVAAMTGRFLYLTTDSGLYYCTGSSWVKLGVAGAGVPTSTTITAGNGLTGGGDLSANRTISALAANATISVAAPGLSVLSAPKWTTGQTITLSGDVTGVSAAWDGSAAISFATAIGAGVIVDNDVSASANIATSKINGLDTALTGKVPTGRTITSGNGLTGGGTLAGDLTLAVGAGTGITVNADDVALNLTYTDGRYLQLAGGTLTGPLTLNADPTNPLHPATKQYVDLSSQGFSFKNAVKVVSTTNQAATSGLLTIDGVTLVANDRVLLAGQTTASQNGIWVAAAGAWTRATDMDATGELTDGTLVPVGFGTANADSLYMCTATGASPWVAGTSTSTWTKFTSLTDLSAGAGLTKTGGQIDFVAGDASLTVAADSVVVASAPKWTTGRTITLTGDTTGVSGAFDGTGALSFATVGVQAAKWTTARTETLTGDITGSTSVDGSANWSLTTAIAAGVIVDADVNATAAIQQTKISGLTTSLSGKADNTITISAGNGLTGGGNLTANRTISALAADSSISVAVGGLSVVSAPKWTTGRTLQLTGDVTGTSAAFDGSGNVTLATTVVGGATFAKKFAADIPAGTSATILHSLGTRDVDVEVYRTTTPWDTVMCDVERPDTNNITVRFATAVTAAQYRVVVRG